MSKVLRVKHLNLYKPQQYQIEVPGFSADWKKLNKKLKFLSFLFRKSSFFIFLFFITQK